MGKVGDLTKWAESESQDTLSQIKEGWVGFQTRSDPSGIPLFSKKRRPGKAKRPFISVWEFVHPRRPHEQGICSKTITQAVDKYYLGKKLMYGWRKS